MEANFSKKKISKHKKKPVVIKKLEAALPENNEKKRININFSFLIPIVAILILSIGIVKAVKSMDFGVFLRVAGENLQADTFGHTNFLILGTGGKEHEGSDLTDSIIVASLDEESNKLSMVSIPRDYWIEDNIVGNSKINEVYYYAKNYFDSEREGLEHLKDKVEELMGIPIHYWLKIDFDGFKELIDAMGGIDIYVEEAIYDPYYPKDGTIKYETFSISAGQHHMDGETALKYARSRKTTSDFDRAERQQEIIYAIKEKALQTEILFSQESIKEILESLSKNISTNITAKELFTLGSIAKDYSAEQIIHRLIHDDPNYCGGFLYTPSREFYNGLFVLRPAGSEEYLHWYSDLIFNTPYIAPEETTIHILNGTSTIGVAGETKQVLRRLCFEINRFGNANNQNISQTTYYYKEVNDENGNPVYERPAALDFLQQIIPGEESTQVPEEYEEYIKKADLVLEIGSDYTDSQNYIEDPFYYLPPPQSATSKEEESEDSESEPETENPTDNPDEPSANPAE